MTEMTRQIGFTMYFDKMPSGTAQMKRMNRKTGVFFESEAVKASRMEYTLKLKKNAPTMPMTKAVCVNVWFRYGTKDKKKQGSYKTTKPDCDNVVKLLLDCMTDCGYWKDDAQIVSLGIVKSWARSEQSSIAIDIQERRETNETN